MTWNHRVIRTRDGDDYVYTIHEVFYDDDGQPRSWTEDGVNVMSETRAGLGDELFRMIEAVLEPILEVRDGRLVECEPAVVGPIEKAPGLGSGG